MKGIKKQDVKRNARRRRVGAVALALVTFYVLSFTPFVNAKPTQQEVFRSIKQNVGQTTDNSGRGLALILGGVAALIMVMLIGSRIRQRQSVPKVVDRPRKLIREVMKTVPLKPKELKQLKLLVQESGEPVQNPLTLLLCPSVLARAVKNRSAKVDRAVVAQIVRKMGVSAEGTKARRHEGT